MSADIKLYNSLSGEKEVFKPIKEGHVGFYVCGPTVYSDVHLGNCRTFVSFDVIYRFLLDQGYKVRYVRNITDVGHLLDTGEDKMLKKARLEQLEPMEVAQKYTLGFHDMMRLFNTMPPSIEPRATGHILEQIDMIKAILDNGYAYEKNGSIYFDVKAYSADYKNYGKLSGRILEDLFAETRELNKQDEKNHPADFALWIKADENHIMKWDSPWSMGFPGWHLECSAMSTKYLGETFDIHGGGNDLKFPHHENEIAQNKGACGHALAHYWLHANMLLMNGKKMSKSDGNTITPEELFTGNSEHVSKGYHPLIVRFFMLQTHYRSTLDIGDEALQASEKGFYRLIEGMKALTKLQGAAPEAGDLDERLEQLMDNAISHMRDDFNTPMALAELFEIVKIVNSIKNQQISPDAVTAESIEKTRAFMKRMVEDVLGLHDIAGSGNDGTLDNVMGLIIDIRQKAREKKDWDTADMIRDRLKESSIVIKDGQGGTEWQQS